MRGKAALGVLALFSPTAWRAAGKTAKEAVAIARNMTLTATAASAVVVYWWRQQSELVHVLVIATAVSLGVLWLLHLVTRRRPKLVKPTPGAEPTQVLYRWWEPSDLPHGLVCYCGKERVPGELIYIGITGAHRSRELDDDRRQACWWLQQPSPVGTQELFGTRAEVEAAEIYAIRTEDPRENIAHAAGRHW